jgi:hypothetical protein
MCWSKKFAIRITRKNKDLCEFLFLSQYDLRPDGGPRLTDRDIGKYFTFTVNRSRTIANRKIKSYENLHDDDCPNCNDNSINLLDTFKI